MYLSHPDIKKSLLSFRRDVSLFFNTNTQYKYCPIEAEVDIGSCTYQKRATLEAAPIESVQCAYWKHIFVEPIKSAVFLCITKVL